MSAARVRRAVVPRRARTPGSGLGDEATDGASVAGEEDPGAALDLPPPTTTDLARAEAARTAGPVGSTGPGLSPASDPQDPHPLTDPPDPPEAPPAPAPARAGASRSGPRRPR